MNFNDFLNLKNEPQTPPPSGKKSLRDILGQSQATHQPLQNEAAQAAANYLNGKVTPQQAEQFTQNDQGLGGFFDPVIKAGGYVTDKITGAMDSAADYLNSKIYNEKEQKDIKVTEGIAKIDNRYGLTPRVQNLINGNGFELDKAQKDEIEAAKIKYLNDNGYNTYFKTLDNGNRELMVEMSDGRIVPADAGVLNSLWAAKGEILGSVFGGVKGAKAGADLLKALGGGKKAATAGAVAGGAALGGAGAVTGAYGDLSKLQQENLIDLSDAELLKEAKLRGVEDVAASLVGAAAIPPILKAISVGAKGSFNLGGKAIDIMPILSQLRKQNIDGALKSAEAQVGGKEAFNAIIAEQNAKGMGLEIASGTKSAQSARAAMGEAKTAADALKNERLNTAANSALNTGQKAIDWVENVLFDNAAMTEGQAKILQAARANPRIAQVLQEQIMRDPQAANGIMQIINRDADGLITKIGGAIDEGFSLKKEFGTYEAGVKRDFGSAVDEISNQYDGVVTALKADDPANAEFINQINGVLNGMWGEKLTPNLSRILSDLSDGRAISVKDINTLRAELNAVIDKSTDGTQRYTAGLIKDFVDTKLMGDILNQRPDLAPKARELYSNALKEYAQMSQIKESGWGRNVGKIDVGENTIYTQMGRVLDEQVDGNSVDMFLSKISPQNAEQVEMRLINGVIESMTRQIDGGRVVDYEKVAAALSKRKFTSKAAADTIALISDLSRLIGQDSKIAQAASRYQNPLKMSQGISQNPAVRFLTMGANRTTNLLLRLLPIVGRDPAMAHHLSVAARNASDYNGFIAEISKMAKDNNFKPALRAAIAKFVREADNGNTRPPNGGGTPPSGGAPTPPPTTPRTPTNKETLQDKRLKSPSGEGNASKAFDSGAAKSTAPKNDIKKDKSPDDILNLKKDLERKRAAIKAEPTAEQAKADKLKLQINAIDEAMETARKKGKLTEQMTQKMEAKKVQITKEINRLIGDIEQNIFIKWPDPFTEMRDRIRLAKEDAMASQKKTATKNAHTNQAARADEISGYNEAMSDLADDFTPPTPPTPKSGSINGAAKVKAAVENVTFKDTKIAEQIGFKHPSDVKFEVGQSAKNHILKRHGADSELVKNSGQVAVKESEIDNFGLIVNSANEHKIGTNNKGQKVLISFKQINGHFVVVETISTKQNKLKLETMYKEKGDFKSSVAYEKAQPLSFEGLPQRAQKTPSTGEIVAKQPLNSAEKMQKPRPANEVVADNIELMNKIESGDATKMQINRYYAMLQSMVKTRKSRAEQDLANSMGIAKNKPLAAQILEYDKKAALDPNTEPPEKWHQAQLIYKEAFAKAFDEVERVRNEAINNPSFESLVNHKMSAKKDGGW